VSYATSEQWSRGDQAWEQQPQAAASRPAGRDPRAEEQAEANRYGWVTIRNNALMRLRKMTYGHMLLAVEPPRGRVPGPHALAFLYAWHAPNSTQRTPIFEVAAATRLFDDTEDTRPGHNVRDLPALLRGLSEVAVDRIREGGFDPRTSMSDRADDMPRQADFVGIGVSSLGEPGVEWPRSRAAALSAPGLSQLHLPMMWRIRLIDGTRIEVSRRLGTVQEAVSSSAPLDQPGSLSGAYWSRMPEPYQPAPGGTDHWLDSLCLHIEDGIRQTTLHSRRHRPPHA
jgi:hypothetical protein